MSCTKIECDGGQHCNNNYDKFRDRFLTSQCFKVLRFWNNEIHEDIDGVLEVIIASVNYSIQTATPLWIELLQPGGHILKQEH